MHAVTRPPVGDGWSVAGQLTSDVIPPCCLCHFVVSQVATTFFLQVPMKLVQLLKAARGSAPILGILPRFYEKGQVGCNAMEQCRTCYKALTQAIFLCGHFFGQHRHTSGKSDAAILQRIADFRFVRCMQVDWQTIGGEAST